jgi:hypothetical protein
VSKADCEQTLVPAVDQALKANERIRLYREIGLAFFGASPHAMWEDF